MSKVDEALKRLEKVFEAANKRKLRVVSAQNPSNFLEEFKLRDSKKLSAFRLEPGPHWLTCPHKGELGRCEAQQCVAFSARQEVAEHNLPVAWCLVFNLVLGVWAEPDDVVAVLSGRKRLG